MRSEDRKEVLQWLDRIEEIAVSNQVKTRLLDAVREYKKELKSDLTREEWVVKSQELEDLLGQIKKQIPCDFEEEDLTEEIRQKAFEMLERCKRSNGVLREDYINDSATYIQETERSMDELCNVQANYDEVTNKERFINVMGSIGQKYKVQVDAFQEKYISALLQNYQNVFDRLKGLFTSTGYGKEAQREFYETYYENQDGLARDTQGYARNLEKGQSSIAKYAENVQALIQQAVSRIKRKAARKKWMPILIIALIAVLGIAGQAVRQHMDAAAEQEMQAEETEEISNKQKLLEITEQVLEKKVDEAADKGTSGFLEMFAVGGTMMVGVPVLILLVLLLFGLYWFWIQGVKKRCRNSIIEEAEKLQRTSLEEWKQEGSLAAAVGESFGMIEAYADKKHQELLSQLLNNQMKTDPEKAKFAKICSDWENIKRKVEF